MFRSLAPRVFGVAVLAVSVVFNGSGVDAAHVFSKETQQGDFVQDAQVQDAQAQDAADLAGIWSGKLNVGAFELLIIFHIKADGEGSYSATMDVPDQGAADIAVDSVTFEDGKLELSIANLAIELTGELSDDGNELKCTFAQAGMENPLVLARTDEVKPRARPQTPQPPFPYDIQEVAYDNEHAEDVRLAGTLTIPEGDGPFPAVVLISGSGPQDRDETIFAHRPFWVIADYLARRGVAVLRFDDRGVGESTGDHVQATSLDFADDVQAGVEFLVQHEKIDKEHIGLAGHSEGGLISPIVANRCEDVAFVILLAGPAVTGEEIITTQSRDILEVTMPDIDIDSEIEQLEKFLAIIREAEDDAEAKTKIAEMTRELLEEESDEALLEALNRLGMPADELESREQKIDAIVAKTGDSVERLFSPWMEFFLPYDPRVELRKLTKPTLAVIGENDLQVNAAVNLPEIEKALLAAGNQDFIVMELPKLNHLFQTSETGSTTEYGELEETFAPSMLELMGDWILERSR